MFRKVSIILVLLLTLIPSMVGNSNISDEAFFHVMFLSNKLSVIILASLFINEIKGIKGRLIMLAVLVLSSLFTINYLYQIAEPEKLVIHAENS